MLIKRAIKAMWEAHTNGRAVAKACHKELAELYEERLTAGCNEVEPVSLLIGTPYLTGSITFRVSF